MTDEEDDEVVYDLDEWTDIERDRLSALLQERGIPFSWEGPDALIIPGSYEEEAEAALDDIEYPDALDEVDLSDQGASEAAQAMLGDLYVAADRLVSKPFDSRAADAATTASASLIDTSAPYGFSEEDWAEVRQRGLDLTRCIEEGQDPDRVSEVARRVRDDLRPYV